MAWTLTTSGSAIIAAGANANSTITASGSALTAWSNEAEGKICAETHYDWISFYADVGTQIKNALADICSALIAINIVKYDPSGYSNAREAETILDVLDNKATAGIENLKKQLNQKLPPQ